MRLPRGIFKVVKLRPEAVLLLATNSVNLAFPAIRCTRVGLSICRTGLHWVCPPPSPFIQNQVFLCDARLKIFCYLPPSPLLVFLSSLTRSDPFWKQLPIRQEPISCFRVLLFFLHGGSKQQVYFFMIKQISRR